MIEPTDNMNSSADPSDDDDYALDDSIFSALRLAIASGDGPRLIALLEPLHPADVADILEQVTPSERREILFLASSAISGDVLSELDENLRDEVIEFLPEDRLTEALRTLESDDVVDLLEDLDEPQQEALLESLEAPDRIAAEQALSYPEDSAGRLMQRETVSVPEYWDVGQTIDYMRESDHLPEQFYHVILVDPRHKPVGYVSLGKLMGSPRATAMKTLCEDNFRTIPVLQDEGDVAYAFNQYHLISAPVVDADDRLIGMITIDDAMVVLDEEHEEDIMRLAGLGEESLSDRTSTIVKQRFPWLLVNLCAAMLSSVVISQFEETIAAIVALAILMPIVASMGGNAGTQSLTVAVRALATKDLTSSNALRVVRREAGSALINGLAFALILGVIVTLWFGQPELGFVIAGAMIMNMLLAGLAGVVVPITLEKLGADPALASGTFVTMTTDIAGFMSFLGLATLFLI